MDPNSLEILTRSHQKVSPASVHCLSMALFCQGLQSCLQAIDQFERLKADYEALKRRLETIAEKTRHEVMAPIVSTTSRRPPVALMSGYIQHTNEILVLLGDDWFVDTSAKHAVEIVDRRIAKCDETLEKFLEEKEQLEKWMSITNQLAEEKLREGLTEIVEEYDEEEERQWREKHRMSVRKEKQEEAKERLKNSKKEDLNQLFEKLEMEEEAERAKAVKEDKPLKSILKKRDKTEKKSVTLFCPDKEPESIPIVTDPVVYPVPKPIFETTQESRGAEKLETSNAKLEPSPFSGLVVERDPLSSSTQKKPEVTESKRVSRFKARK